MEGHGEVPRLKNGPALAGHGAEAVRDEIARVITTLPELLRRSLTWGPGSEMAEHAKLRVATGLTIYPAIRTWSLAAWHEREHQWASPPVLHEGHRLVSTQPR